MNLERLLTQKADFRLLKSFTRGKFAKETVVLGTYRARRVAVITASYVSSLTSRSEIAVKVPEKFRIRFFKQARWSKESTPVISSEWFHASRRFFATPFAADLQKAKSLARAWISLEPQEAGSLCYSHVLFTALALRGNVQSPSHVVHLLDLAIAMDDAIQQWAKDYSVWAVKTP